MRRGLSVAALVACALLVGACGSDDGGGQGATLNWWAYNEPSGSFRQAADRCTKESNGRYRIVFNALGNDPNTQRQSLVRRLAAKDSSIDLMSMDVIWTAEFAEAGWIKPWPESFASQVREGTLKAPVQTATYKGRLYGAPANSNTQLLWYRKDLVKTPPKTWDEMIDQASKMPEAGRIEIQGAAYEGYTVWFNSLVQSAGGSILRGADQVELGPPAERAAEIISKLANSKAADPSLSTQKEDQNRLAFEQGEAAFQVNYPFIYPSAREGNPEVFKQIAWAPYPAVDPGKPAKAPVGGFNWGVGGYTKHPEEAFEAATCLRDEQSQRLFANLGGLPPTLEAVYDDPKFKETYPFADLIRRQLDNGAVRPQSPAYADVSLGVYTALWPPASVDPRTSVSQLRETIEQALDSRALL
jgi:multiple sugar transport system substrate-binding protein